MKLPWRKHAGGEKGGGEMLSTETAGVDEGLSEIEKARRDVMLACLEAVKGQAARGQEGPKAEFTLAQEEESPQLGLAPPESQPEGERAERKCDGSFSREPTPAAAAEIAQITRSKRSRNIEFACETLPEADGRGRQALFRTLFPQPQVIADGQLTSPIVDNLMRTIVEQDIWAHRQRQNQICQPLDLPI